MPAHCYQRLSIAFHGTLYVLFDFNVAAMPCRRTFSCLPQPARPADPYAGTAPDPDPDQGNVPRLRYASSVATSMHNAIITVPSR
jgi:hypothetical protein